MNISRGMWRLAWAFWLVTVAGILFITFADHWGEWSRAFEFSFKLLATWSIVYWACVLIIRWIWRGFVSDQQ